MIHISHLAHAASAARRHRLRNPGLPGNRSQRRTSACKPGEVGKLAVKGLTGCRYLADERQTDYVIAKEKCAAGM
jgi:2-aminobenzoate-CoA ligase